MARSESFKQDILERMTVAYEIGGLIEESKKILPWLNYKECMQLKEFFRTVRQRLEEEEE